MPTLILQVDFLQFYTNLFAEQPQNKSVITTTNEQHSFDVIWKRIYCRKKRTIDCMHKHFKDRGKKGGGKDDANALRFQVF